MMEQCSHIGCSAVWRDHQPDGHRGVQSFAVEFKLLCTDHVDDPLTDRFRIDVGVEQDQELIAAPAALFTAAAERIEDRLSETADHDIAVEMSEVVVDKLEVVNIQNSNRGGLELFHRIPDE